MASCDDRDGMKFSEFPAHAWLTHSFLDDDAPGGPSAVPLVAQAPGTWWRKRPAPGNASARLAVQEAR
jgi:hypothetical protein